MLGEQFQQLPKAGSVVIDAPLGDHLPAIVDNGDVVVVFCPIDPTKRFQSSPFLCNPHRTVLGHAPH